MSFQIEFEREEDGRWIAEIPELPGVICYGATKQEAAAASVFAQQTKPLREVLSSV